MPKLAEYIVAETFLDRNFVGTIAFRDEKLSLPDGSKMALGLDDGHWVLIYQGQAGASFKVFEYDQHNDKLLIDKRSGNKEDFGLFKKLVANFYRGADIGDLVTILPPGA